MRSGGTPWNPPADRLALGPERLLFVDVSVPQRPVTWQPGVEITRDLLAEYPYLPDSERDY